MEFITQEKEWTTRRDPMVKKDDGEEWTMKHNDGGGYEGIMYEEVLERDGSIESVEGGERNGCPEHQSSERSRSGSVLQPCRFLRDNLVEQLRYASNTAAALYHVFRHG